MISIQAKKHDNFSVEFKFGMNCTIDGAADNFVINAWMFMPNSLDVTPENYGKDQFYRDIKSNVRLITPVFSLDALAQDDSLPMRSLKTAVGQVALYPSETSVVDTYEYHLKMYAAIFKSALREQARHLMRSCSLPDASDLIDAYVVNIRKALDGFRELFQMIDRPEVPERVKNSFRMCDEFMTHVLDVRTIRLLKLLETSEDEDVCQPMRSRLADMLAGEHDYRRRVGYEMLTGDSDKDRQLMHHYGMLKKYIESELYIKLEKKKDGVAVQQIYYSLAAGVAMVFATAVSWHSQARYGSVTWPLFVALVISYMLKDRIKDLLRYYFAHKLGNKYFDKKAVIAIGSSKVGSIKEGFDFISGPKVPVEVKNMRDRSSFVEGESSIFDEKIMLYRQRVSLDETALAVKDQYPRVGLNEILRLHLTRFTYKMDNPKMTVDTVDDHGNISPLSVQKIYYINVVFQLVHDGKTQYRQFRIAMSREGIKEIEQIN